MDAKDLLIKKQAVEIKTLKETIAWLEQAKISVANSLKTVNGYNYFYLHNWSALLSL